MPHASSHGIRIAYDDLGRGEPALLFLPGWCVPRTVFADLLPLCSRNRRVLALDWRGHGESAPSSSDFGDVALAEDALAVIKASGARSIVPVAQAHAGWVAVELRHALKDRIPLLVFLDWIITEAPASFVAVLDGMRSTERWRETKDSLFAQWLENTDNRKVSDFVRKEVNSCPADMWSRAAREIAAAYSRFASPLKLLSSLKPPVPTLHLYSQPDDPSYFAAQESFAADHPWFRVRKLPARTHFPMLEVPSLIADAIESSVAETMTAQARP